MLIDRLQEDLNASLKAGKAVRVGALRFLIAAVRNHAIDKYKAAGEKSLTDEDIVEIVKKQIKTHKESIEAFEKAGRGELADKEKQELEILTEFAPKEISDEELRKLLDPVIASAKNNLPAGRQDFGLLMKQAMAAVSGKADGGRVAALLKEMQQR